MGKNFLADVPGNSFQKIFTAASVASNADGIVGTAALVAESNMKIKRAWFIPWADQATQGTATTSATYRRINILNGSTDGSGTAIIASCNITASIASRGSKAFATTANNTVSAGYMVYFSALTVGGTDNDGTILQAGVIQLEYELL
jgi:hypothetical protein